MQASAHGRSNVENIYEIRSSLASVRRPGRGTSPLTGGISSPDQEGRLTAVPRGRPFPLAWYMLSHTVASSDSRAPCTNTREP